MDAQQVITTCRYKRIKGSINNDSTESTKVEHHCWYTKVTGFDNDGTKSIK